MTLAVECDIEHKVNQPKSFHRYQTNADSNIEEQYRDQIHYHSLGPKGSFENRGPIKMLMKLCLMAIIA